MNILQNDQIEFGGQLRAYSSKGCFHGASILDLQKGVCHAAANDDAICLVNQILDELDPEMKT